MKKETMQDAVCMQAEEWIDMWVVCIVQKRMEQLLLGRIIFGRFERSST